MEGSMPGTDANKKASDFKVKRDHWADHNIYFGAVVQVGKVFEKETLSGKIIGLSEFHYLIMEIPLVIGYRARYAPGSTVVVKFVKDGTVYGFYSEVLQIQYDPAPLMYLKYPVEVESFEFRENRRFVGKIPARMYNEAAHYSCLINDISTGGCSLIVHHSSLKSEFDLVPGDQVRVIMNLYGLGELELACHVRGVSELDGHLCYGVQFVDSGEHYEKIIRYLDMLEK